MYGGTEKGAEDDIFRPRRSGRGPKLSELDLQLSLAHD